MSHVSSYINLIPKCFDLSRILTRVSQQMSSSQKKCLHFNTVNNAILQRHIIVSVNIFIGSRLLTKIIYLRKHRSESSRRLCKFLMQYAERNFSLFIIVNIVYR